MEEKKYVWERKVLKRVKKRGTKQKWKQTREKKNDERWNGRKRSEHGRETEKKWKTQRKDTKQEKNMKEKRWI